MADSRQPTRIRRVLWAIALVATGWGCAYLPVFDPLAPLELVHAPSAVARVPASRRVVLISVDGLAPWVLEGAEAPTLRRLAAEGVSAREAVTIDPSITLPSHASMLTGVGPEVHGVSWNVYRPWGRLAAPTLFTQCASTGLRCDLFVSKRKFSLFAEDEPGVRRYRCQSLAAEVLVSARASLEDEDPDLVVIHLSELDHAGHRSGWGSAAQRDALESLDAQLGEFLAAAQAASSRPLAVILTADHGGFDRNHRSKRWENRHIPWIAWGDGVDRNAQLEEVSTLDTAPTVAALLGLEIPAAWPGQPRALETSVSN